MEGKYHSREDLDRVLAGIAEQALTAEDTVTTRESPGLQDFLPEPSCASWFLHLDLPRRISGGLFLPQHIGIVACSAEGAALCYRTICLEGAEYLGRHNHPEVSLHTHPLAAYMECIYASDWAGSGGANAVLRREAWPRPAPIFWFVPTTPFTRHSIWLSTARRVPGCISPKKLRTRPRESNYKRLGVLGTKYLMEGPVYPEKLKAAGLEFRTPGPKERERINHIIMDELVNAQFTPNAR